MATQPPIPDITSYPFKSSDLGSLGAFVQNIAVLSPTYFLVADERTIKDNSLLFVAFSADGPGSISAVRIDGSFANRVPIAVAMGIIDIDSVQGLADEKEGIFRG